MSILVKDVINELAILPQVCPDDPRLYRYITSAQRQIFLEGQYTGVLASYNFLLYNAVLTLPYEVEAILQADILSVPINVNNMWFEFLQSGPGYQDPKRAFTYADLYDRGDSWCTIQDPPGPFTIQVYCAVPEDPNAVVIIEGLDQNGNQIRSQITVQNGDGTVSGQWINGVQLPLYSPPAAFNETTQLFTKVTAIQFPQRNGDVRLFANQSGTTFLLGVYPYFMTNPTFRRYYFPAAVQINETFKPLPVNTLVRRRPIPVQGPNDRLSINNVEALKWFVQAAWKMEEEQWDVAASLRAQGKYYLEQETRKSGAGMDRLNVSFRGFMQFQSTPGSL